MLTITGPLTDQAMPWLEECLRCENATSRLRVAGAIEDEEFVSEANLIKYRESRRAVIEYEIGGGRTLIGKVRAKGLDRRTIENISKLNACGFDLDSVDGVSIAPVAGVIKDWAMWLSPKVQGEPTSHFVGGAAQRVARRVAHAALKLHRTKVDGLCTHSLTDELELLRKYLGFASARRPDLALRTENLINRCNEIAGRVESDVISTVHRDFYRDQLLISDARVFIIDLDQLAAGDPLLDIGNFSAHVAEQAFRVTGSFSTYDEFRLALLEGYDPHGSARQRICIYETLSLARHIWISMRIPARSHLTDGIIAEVERRLDEAA